MDDRALLGDVPLGKLNGAKVLVVDDEDEIRTFLTTLFEDEGAMVFEAADGVEALEVAERKKPDLVTLDLSMPGKDGIDAFCELRQNPATEEIPELLGGGDLDLHVSHMLNTVCDTIELFIGNATIQASRIHALIVEPDRVRDHISAACTTRVRKNTVWILGYSCRTSNAI